MIDNPYTFVYYKENKI